MTIRPQPDTSPLMASLAVTVAVAAIKTAGRDAFPLSPSSYAEMVINLEKAGDLLAWIEERRVARMEGQAS